MEGRIIPTYQIVPDKSLAVFTYTLFLMAYITIYLILLTYFSSTVSIAQ